MCDYSLEAYQSRPAAEGEKYVSHRFDSGSIGIVDPADKKTAVCMACDMQLALTNIPKDVRKRCAVTKSEEVTFIRIENEQPAPPQSEVLDQDGNNILSHVLTFRSILGIETYKDGVRFRNGKEILLQELATGVGIVVTDALTKPVKVRKKAVSA